MIKGGADRQSLDHNVGHLTDTYFLFVSTKPSDIATTLSSATVAL